MRMIVRKLMLDLYDLDRNHVLDREERRNLLDDAKRSKRECALRLAERFDTDKDGILGPDGEKALRAYVEERRKTKHGLPDFSRQPEGDLCTVPLPPPPHHRYCPECKCMAPHPHPHRPNSLSQEAQLVAFISRHLIMAAYDTNNDGILDKSESRQLGEDGQWLYAMREKALLNTYDTNRDGHISRDELKTALESMFIPNPDEPERGRERPPQTPLDRMLDTQFDADILLHLSQQ